MGTSFGRKDLCHFNEAMIDLEISQAISALNRLRNQVEGFRK